MRTCGTGQSDRVMGHKNMVVGPLGPRTKNDKDKQQITGLKSITSHGLTVSLELAVAVGG
jgi:hypothetical protein